jgi:hypothetical protein
VSTGNVLTPGTTYYYRVVATNATGSSEGPIEEFTALSTERPIIGSETVVAPDSLEPALEAKVNPNYQETEYQFEYSTKATGEVLEGTITTIDGAAKLPGVFEELAAGPVVPHGLQPGPTYYYRVVATNATGSSAGLVHSFQARATPAVSAPAAQERTRTTVMVSGDVIPQGLQSSYHFVYITQAAYDAAVAAGEPNPYAGGKSTHETALEGADYATHPVQLLLEELTAGTTYDVAVVASNELGSTTGPSGSFTTSAATPPIAITGSAEGISQQSARLDGSVDTRGLQVSSQFELGTTPGAGTLLPAAVTSGSGNVQTLSLGLSGDLLPGTTYYYRVVASSRDGVSYGSEQSFTTSTFAPSFSSSSVPAPIPYSTISELDAKEAKETPKATHVPTRAEKLAKALKACQRKPKKQRPACERRAKKQYSAKAKTKPKAKRG